MASSTKRVAIVTGATQGIGRGIAQRLAKDGLHLGLFDLPNCKESLEELASSLREFGTKVVTVYGDVSVEDDVRRSESCMRYALNAKHVQSQDRSLTVHADDSKRRHMLLVRAA